MPLVVLAGSAMVASSIPILILALLADRPRSHRASQVLAGHTPTMRESELQRSALERMIVPVTRRLGARLLRFTPIGWVGRRNLMVAKAGLSGRVTAEQILGAKLLLPLVVAGFLGLQLVGDGDPRTILLLAFGTLFAFFVPDLLLKAAADRRAEAISDALPDLLDQVTIAVEAGLDFESALSRSCAGQDHPLAVEFLRTLQDVRLGAGRADALTALAERSQVDDLKSVVLSLRQADSLGVPLSRTLRTLANEMREKRRYRAEEKAQRLPTLMIFPLGFCILPALFIVILGPVIVTGFTP